MLDNGEDLVAVQRSLGHSRVNITADLYVGRVPIAQRKAIMRYGELLSGTVQDGR
jgi:integrase